jgi:DNA-binding NtrC family response regulator
VRCGDIEGAEIESALFGAERGGAPAGRLREASGGTLFLDEIGALPAGAQATLARLLGDGDSDAPAHALPGDVRLIAATSRRLVDLVSQGGFHKACLIG